MNKIYSDPIEKAKMFVESVKKQEHILRGKGITIDVETLTNAYSLLEECGRKQEAVEAELKGVREEAHNKLEVLKALYTEYKTPIKQNFPLEAWVTFGLPDKKWGSLHFSFFKIVAFI